MAKKSARSSVELMSGGIAIVTFTVKCATKDEGNCTQHPDWIQCSGKCERWFHLECVKWTVKRDPTTNQPTSIVAPWDASTEILLDGLSDGNSNPWYCIACWELQKANKQPRAFDDCSLSEKAMRLGLDIPEGVINESSGFQQKNAAIGQGLQGITWNSGLSLTCLTKS